MKRILTLAMMLFLLSGCTYYEVYSIKDFIHVDNEEVYVFVEEKAGEIQEIICVFAPHTDFTNMNTVAVKKKRGAFLFPFKNKKTYVCLGLNK